MRLLIVGNGVVVVVVVGGGGGGGGGGVGSGRDRKVILGITWGIWVWLVRLRGAASHFSPFFFLFGKKMDERMKCESFALY